MTIENNKTKDNKTEYKKTRRLQNLKTKSDKTRRQKTVRSENNMTIEDYDNQNKTKVRRLTERLNLKDYKKTRRP